jgi:hypothetical protein
MGWCIVYLIIFFQIDSVLNVVSAVFASVLGLKIYSRVTKCDSFEESINLVEGLVSSSIGVILMMSCMSYLFISFDTASTVTTMVIAIAFSFVIA